MHEALIPNDLIPIYNRPNTQYMADLIPGTQYTTPEIPDAKDSLHNSHNI